MSWNANCNPGNCTIAQSKTANPIVYAAILSALRELGIPFRETDYQGSTTGFQIAGGWESRRKLLVWCKPRKREKLEKSLYMTKFSMPDAVIAVERAPVSEVISLTTSTGNYIAWGYASKNCAADTFQGMFYPLLWFCKNPAIEEITFRLVFVRWDAKREVTYTRADVPRLIGLARGERDRQAKLHSDLDVLEPMSGAHCLWCPLLRDGCPLGSDNPTSKEPEYWLRRAIYLDHASQTAKKTLRDMVGELDASVSCADANGTEYEAAWGIKQNKKFPLVESLPILSNWAQQTGEAIFDPLTISGLSGLLKAKKRADLADMLANVAEVEQQAAFSIGEKDAEETV